MKVSPVDDDFVSINNWFAFEQVGDMLFGRLSSFVANPAWIVWKRTGQGKQPIRGQFVVITDKGLTRFNYTAAMSKLLSLPAGIRVRITFTEERSIKLKDGSTARVKEYDYAVPKAELILIQELLAANGTIPVTYEALLQQDAEHTSASVIEWDPQDDEVTEASE